VARLTPFTREICGRQIDHLAPRGGCDFVSELALQFPTEVFLKVLNQPVEDAAMFLGWVRTFFSGHNSVDKEPIVHAAASIRGYFSDVLSDRRRNPQDADDDIMTDLMSSEVRNRKLTDDEILDIFYILIAAGLDTTQSQMSYLMHPARH